MTNTRIPPPSLALPAALFPRAEEDQRASSRPAGQQAPKTTAGIGTGGQDDLGKAENSAAGGVNPGKAVNPSALSFGIRPTANASGSGVSLGRGHAPRSRSIESKKSSKPSSSSASSSHTSDTGSSESELDMAAVMGFGGFVGRKDDQNKEKQKSKVNDSGQGDSDKPAAGPAAYWTESGLRAHREHYSLGTIYRKNASEPEALAKERYRKDSTDAANRPSSTQSPEHVIQNETVDLGNHRRNRAAGDKQKYSKTKQFFTVVTPDSRMRTAYPEETTSGYSKILEERRLDDRRQPSLFPDSQKRKADGVDLTDEGKKPTSLKRQKPDDGAHK